MIKKAKIEKSSKDSDDDLRSSANAENNTANPQVKESWQPTNLTNHSHSSFCKTGGLFTFMYLKIPQTGILKCLKALTIGVHLTNLAADRGKRRNE